MSQEPKHIAQLDPTRRALVDQATRDCMLAIVAAQGKPVTIPIEDLDEISRSHRLVVLIDRDAGIVTLTAEKAEVLIEAPHALQG